MVKHLLGCNNDKEFEVQENIESISFCGNTVSSILKMKKILYLFLLNKDTSHSLELIFVVHFIL